MRRIVAGLACLLAASAAAAQTPAPDTTKRVRQTLYVTYGTLQALDIHSTIRDLSRRQASEPTGYQGGALIVTHAATAAATIYAMERLAKPHPKLAVLIMASVTVASAAIVAQNYRRLQADQSQP